MKSELPALGRPTRLDRPEWLKVRLNTTGEYEEVRQMMRRLSLVTVCEEARCPNIHECWARERTATFMLMGDICTRHCGFCAVGKGRPGALDAEEPERVAEAARELRLSHAVVTSVNRDDLPDGGAAHFAATIRAIRRRNPGCTIEVLIPDFQGDAEALDRVLDEAPEILNHNMETVSRLYRRVRPDAGYAQSLELISRAARRRDRERLRLRTKSGLMVGLGESEDEVRGASLGPARGRLRHRDDRTVPATARAAPADRALLHARGVRAPAARRRSHGLPARRVRAARALFLPRPPCPRGAGGLKDSMTLARRLAIAAAALAILAGGTAAAQDRGAVRTKNVDPVYPENLLKTQRQGNVLLAGRIDTHGKLTSIATMGATSKDFVQAAVTAVQQWDFRPATRNGKPLEIFANVAVRFRIQNEARGQIPGPILGDIAISPADAAGKATAPEGFPIQRGKDPALRAEVMLDAPPAKERKTLTVRVEARSPKGRKIPVFQPPVALAAGATEVRFPLVVQIGKDWEDGVWALVFTVDGANAGGGQFWLAADPAHFHFVIPQS